MDTFTLGWVVVVEAFVLFGAGHCMGFCCGLRTREKEAIEKGFAQYNPQTGDWEWLSRG